MKSPREMDEQVETYIGYMAVGVMCLLIITIIILAVQLLVGLLAAISMGV